MMLYNKSVEMKMGAFLLFLARGNKREVPVGDDCKTRTVHMWYRYSYLKEQKCRYLLSMSIPSGLN